MTARTRGAWRATPLGWLACALPPLCAGLFRVWVHADAVQMGYALSVQEREHAQLAESVHELELALAAARSPARLMALGRGLGLRPPETEQRAYVAAPAQLAQRAAPRGGHARP